MSLVNMNTNTTTSELEELQIKSFLQQLNEDMLLSMRCASICAAFISGAYLSASIQELVEVLWNRHKTNPENTTDQKSVYEHVKDLTTEAIQWGLKNHIFNQEHNGKISPTEEGWFIGKDWEYKLRNGW